MVNIVVRNKKPEKTQGGLEPSTLIIFKSCSCLPFFDGEVSCYIATPSITLYGDMVGYNLG
jgi:hypothetical protein